MIREKHLGSSKIINEVFQKIEITKIYIISNILWFKLLIRNIIIYIHIIFVKAL